MNFGRVSGKCMLKVDCITKAFILEIPGKALQASYGVMLSTAQFHRDTQGLCKFGWTMWISKICLLSRGVKLCK